MCHYKHLTPFERERILFFLSRGESITKIAQLLNRSKSTISREIRRNAASADPSMPDYLPFEAQTLYVQRRKACRPHKRLDNTSLQFYVQTCILEFQLIFFYMACIPSLFKGFVSAYNIYFLPFLTFGGHFIPEPILFFFTPFSRILSD